MANKKRALEIALKKKKKMVKAAAAAKKKQCGKTFPRPIIE